MSNISFLVLFLGVVVLATPSTSRSLTELNREDIEQLYVEAQAIVDTLDEETAKHHLAPLPTKECDKAVKIRKEVKDSLEEALSPSGGILDIDDEINKYFAGSPSAKLALDELEKEALKTWTIDEDIKEINKYFAGSPSAKLAVDELEKEALKTWAVDEEAENYHHFALSPADRLEELAAEKELEELAKTYTTP